MATKAKTRGQTLQIGLVSAEPEQEQGAEFDVLELARVMEEMDAVEGARIMIVRTWPKAPGESGYLGEMSPSEFSYESVRQAYGGGKYRWRVMGPGNKFMEGGGAMSIAGPPIHPAAPARPGAAAATNEPQSLQSMLTTLDEREQARSAARMQQWKEWATILSPLLAPLLMKLVPGESSAFKPSDMLAVLREAREMNPPAESGDRIETFIKALEVANTLRGEAGESGSSQSNWIDLVREGIGIVRPAAQDLIRRAALGAPNVPTGIPAAAPRLPSMDDTSAAAPAAAPATPPTEAPPGNPMLQYLPWLRANLAQLKMQASRARNPELYAEVFLDNLPAGMTLPQVYELLNHPQWWDRLCMLDDGVKAYEGWFGLFHESLVSMLRRELRVKVTAPPEAAPADAAPDVFNDPSMYQTGDNNDG